MNRKKWYIILAAVSLLAVISTLIIFPKVQNASNTDRADLPLAASGSYTLPAYFEVTKASSGNNAVWHSEPSGSKGTKGSISVGTRITVVDNKKNDKGNWWYKYKDGNGYKWIYGDYITYRGSISSYSATMETKNGGKNWTQPWSNDTSRYTSSGSYGNGRVIKVTEKINRNGTVWYKVSDGRFIYSDNVKTHTCSSTVISKSNYKSINSSQHSYSYTERKCSNSTCPNYSVTNTYSGKENHSYSNGICTKCNDWKAKSTRAVNNVKYVVTESNVKVHSGPYGACSTTCYLSKGDTITVTMSVENYEGHTWYKYSGGYIYSDYVKEHSSCTWDSGVYTKKPTCTEGGTKKYTCTLCGATKTGSVKALGHTKDNVCTRCGYWSKDSLKSTTKINNVKYVVYKDGAKIHSGPYGATPTVSSPANKTALVATQKIVNGEGHVWYEVDGGYIYSDYVKEHSSCTWDKGVYTKKPTCTEGGTKKYTCTLCGATKTGSVKALGHTKDNVCTRCGYWSKDSLKSTTKINNVKYVVYKDGAKIHSGPYGATPTVSSPANKTVLTVTQKVVNGEKHIWYKVDGGYIYSDYVKEHSSCTWDSGVYTKKPTCTEGGKKKYTCILCDATKTGTVKALGHKYNKNGICERCSAWDKKSLKSTSSVASVKYVVIKDNAVVHEGPYGACKTTAKLNKETVITVTQKVANSYNKTWYKCSEGYIYADYVQTYDLYYATISLNTSSTTVYKGFTQELKAKVKGPSKKVTWSSSDKNVATVSADGVATGKKTGTCIITAKANGKKATCKITVKNPSITIDKTKTVYLGCKETITYKVDGPSDDIEWASTNKKIATVNKKTGVITPKKDGECTIIAKANGKEAKCTLTVSKPTIKLNISSKTLYSSGQVVIKATVKGGSNTVKWSTSKPSVASVNNGVVTASPGKSADGKSCTITATANGVKATCTIKVSYVNVNSYLTSLDNVKKSEFNYLYKGSINPVRYGGKWYYQFKIDSKDKGPQCIRVLTTAFYSTGKTKESDSTPVMTAYTPGHIKCENTSKELTKLLNNLIKQQNTTGTNAGDDSFYVLNKVGIEPHVEEKAVGDVWPYKDVYIDQNGKIKTKKSKVIWVEKDTDDYLAGYYYVTERDYTSELTAFQFEETLLSKKIRLNAQKYNNETIRFEFKQMYKTGKSGDITEETFYNKALKRTLVKNEVFTPSFVVSINNTGSTKLNLLSYTIHSVGKLEEDTTKKCLEDLVDIAFETVDLVGAIAKPSVYSVLKSVWGGGTKISDLIEGQKPKNNMNLSNGKAIQLTKEKKKKFTYSAEFKSPVELLDTASYFQVEVDLSNNPTATTKMTVEVFIDYEPFDYMRYEPFLD